MVEIARFPAQRPPAPTRSWKTGVRILGVSESFDRGDEFSILAGVVMRGDLRIDGYALCTPKVGGLDATDQLVAMFRRLGRDDVRIWLLNGSVISWFNVVDMGDLWERTGCPVVCVSYEQSAGIESYLKEYFPEDWRDRQAVIDRNGPRHKIRLKTGFTVFVNTAGVSPEDAAVLLNRFTIDGRVPEPLRVARILAAAVRRDLSLSA
ncbi:MAG: DUF99 family protein [Candidatus Thorarchaeota archaeon]